MPISLASGKPTALDLLACDDGIRQYCRPVHDDWRGRRWKERRSLPGGATFLLLLANLIRLSLDF
jgi:hypothetical protein